MRDVVEEEPVATEARPRRTYHMRGRIVSVRDRRGPAPWWAHLPILRRWYL